MKLAVRALVILLGITVGAAACAQVSVKDAWVRGTVAQQKSTGAFMQLSSTEDARLVEAKSPIAPIVEIHEMKMDAGVMKMRPVEALEVPAGRPVELKPGGYHVMLMGLKQELKEGETVPLTLTFETKAGKRSSVEVKASVSSRYACSISVRYAAAWPGSRRRITKALIGRPSCAAQRTSRLGRAGRRRPGGESRRPGDCASR